MSLKESIYSVLVVSASESFYSSIKTVLPEPDCEPVHFVSSISAAKRAMLETVYDFVIINSPLPDEFGTRFAIDAAGKKGTVVLFLVKNELYPENYAKVFEHGVFTLARPTSRQMMTLAFDWLMSARERLRKSEKKTLTVEEKMEEIRIVNHAKWILIDELKMSESEAHHYIEKQSMDNSLPRREVAEQIIRTYS